MVEARRNVLAVRMRCYIHAYEVDKATMVPHKHVKKIIRMDPPVTIITHPETGQEKNFTYDFNDLSPISRIFDLICTDEALII